MSPSAAQTRHAIRNDDWLEMECEDRTHLPDEPDPHQDEAADESSDEREPLLWEEYLR